MQTLTERRMKLEEAIRSNVQNGTPIFTDAGDTSFVEESDVTDEEVIQAIRSVPTHY